jgi:FkbM family methyltransferase
MIINSHTIQMRDVPGLNILDVGSRVFGFSNWFAGRDFNVICLEPDTDIPPAPKGVTVIHAALVGHGNEGQGQLIKWSNGEGNHLSRIHGETPPSHVKQDTPCFNIEQIMKETNVEFWEIVKLDCEGAEYEILKTWPGPISNQITVEFHDFTGSNPNGEETYTEILAHLGQWYDVVQHEKTKLNNIENYWDSLFVLKELV